MTRGRRWLLAGLAAGVAAALAAAVLVPRRAVVTVTSAEDGRLLASMPLPASRRFEMYLRQSIYDADAYEYFQAGAGGGFTMVALRSTNQGVLDYYALEGRRSHDGAWTHMVLDQPARFERLPIVGTALGRRTLIVGGRRFVLAGPDGATRHLVIMVERRSWLLADR
jgi:hypothetical protein